MWKNFGIKKRKENGFASFEFAWSVLVFVILFMIFFEFFQMFHYSSKTLIASRYQAFSTVGQTLEGVSGTGIDQPGLISGEEILSAGGCAGCGENFSRYMATGPAKDYSFLGIGSWQPWSVFVLDWGSP